MDASSPDITPNLPIPDDVRKEEERRLFELSNEVVSQGLRIYNNELAKGRPVGFENSDEEYEQKLFENENLDIEVVDFDEQRQS